MAASACKPSIMVKQAASLTGSLAGSFQLVEGRVANVGVHDGRAFLDFRDDYRQGFSATVAPEDRKAFRNAGFALEDLAGRHVRLRGVIEVFGGRPEVAPSNPYQIEVLD
jgi:micrococcal nuclease